MIMTVRDVKEGISRYMSFYNQERSYQSLDHKTPAKVYFDDKEQRISKRYVKQDKLLS